MIRFRIDNGDTPILTEWVDEMLGDLHQQTAAQRVAELRRDYPTSAISVERSSVIPRKKQKVVRFRVHLTAGVDDGVVGSLPKDTDVFTTPVPIAQKDEEFASLKARFPQAVITPEEREL